nr:DNA helicase RecQ [uncultured Oscillibacter sp.]
MDKQILLKQYFGHSGFRPGQEPLVDALLSGRDALGVMPTGAGKSVCYQLPALLLPGLTLVISPLISLMKDQVAALAQAGIPAAYINSSLDAEEYREVYRRVRRGDCKLLYIAPERLQAEGFRRLLGELPVSLVAVDEAHCVSQWGQDFRPSYLEIAELVRALPVRPPVGAFTATATAAVRRDIETLLELRDPLRVTTGFDRPNLFFEVVRPRDKDLWLSRFLAERPEQSGIVYCATRKAVDAVTAALLAQGVPAARYHAGMEDGERRRSQEGFVYDQARVMVATNAFGMGIDKSNVSFVVHYNMPKDLESYYQEAGRAGRDGSPARCVLLYAPGDVQTAKYLITHSQEAQEGDPERLRRDLIRLDRMVRYCKTTGCLRADLLDYFGEIHSGNCGNCGSCAGDFVERDITVEAQKILSAVARVEKRCAYGLGAAAIIKLLRGSRDRRTLQLGLDRLPTHGALKGVDQERVQRYIDHLMEEGYLRADGEEYPVLRLTARAGDVLFRGQRVLLRERAAKSPPPQAGPAPGPSSGSAPQEADGSLLAALKALRSRLAQEAGVPAYIVFSNAALADMAALRPLDMEEFLKVSGVGRVKAERYGEDFLRAIRDWRAGVRE